MYIPSQSTRLSRFLELLTMDLFSLCRLMKLSKGPKTLGISCFEGHFSQLFNLFNHKSHFSILATFSCFNDWLIESERED